MTFRPTRRTFLMAGAACAAPMPVLANALLTPPPPDSVTAPFVDVRDVASGRALMARRPGHVFWRPASCVKLMTALILVELKGAQLDEPAGEFDETDTLREGLSAMGLEPGDQPTWRALLTGLLFRSGGDAAQMIARRMGGYDCHQAARMAFVDRMNARGDALGFRQSRFADAHGAEITPFTASDLNRLAMAALETREIARLSALASAEADLGRRRMICENANPVVTAEKALLPGKIGNWKATGAPDIENISGVGTFAGRKVAISLMAAPSRKAMLADIRAITDKLEGQTSA